MATREETLLKKRDAYVQYRQGTKIADIAKGMGLSERMVYRYIDEYELVQLRKWKKSVDEALEVTPMNAPVSQLVKIIQARK
ncbi:homeodomain-like protein [Vibrio phage 1.238.A._10N.261.52.F10]|uniref:Homeodomain-like protein n=2 Tax=Pariacacavirus TaxID=2948856 RepID=A0A2I7RUR7_9CAUD|nr:homeodomain-like protein [Vibrio phage 1.238.A._10N.261.52.F10]YP_010093507.1 homeodomain-like protein [Vibrio phage 1.245.O._10N.261.54.C7]AUR97311.1 homeodomain-like protein [Vibrio phage 1.238.A._10N.261.52.F10]AUR97405.1 homeodomain-like protein [Vibrio phage 1.238.B._10N.261.52.F10]AUR97977.1 homeodomain-like protein [Vibrio phage 1.245.O._10N.261.54.C7]